MQKINFAHSTCCGPEAMLLSTVNQEAKRKASQEVQKRNEKLVQEKRIKRTRPVIHKHTRTAATLAVDDAGFTLCIGGTWSVVIDAPFQDKDLVKSVKVGNVRVLYCFDKTTMTRWEKAATTATFEKKHFSVKLLPPFLKKNCIFCKQRCHRWKAVAGMCERSSLPFDPIKH